MITFKCSCSTTLQVKDEHAGRKVQCPKCKNQMVVPALADSPPEEIPSVLLVDAHASEASKPSEERLMVPGDLAPPREGRDRRGEEEEDLEVPRRARATQTSGQAIAALLCGILSFCLPVLLGIPALILGFLALGNINRSGGRLTGGGLAITGIVLGIVGSIGGVLLQIALLVPAVQQVRQAAAKTDCANNLKQITLAFHGYNDNFRTLPPAVVYDANGRPLYSWRVLLLPYLEQMTLYKQFRLDEPWDSPNNIRFVQMMPPVYAHSGVGAGKDPKLCYFQVFDGPSGDQRPRAIFASRTKKRKPLALPGLPEPLSRSDHDLSINRVIDGTSNTILVAEAADGVPWTKPADLVYEPDRPLPGLGGHFANGFWVGMADGSVRFIDPRRVREPTLRAAVTADDGQVLGPEWND
jgi:hypothetical protein